MNCGCSQISPISLETSNLHPLRHGRQQSLSDTPLAFQQWTVTATWSGIAAPTSTDWIGLYPTGASDQYTSRISWRYTTGTASGSVPYTIPATLAPGTYELRLFTNFTYNRIGTSNTFTVTASPPVTASLSVTPSSIAAGGTVTATWSGIAAPTSTDWIGLYAPGRPDSYQYYYRWQYTTGTASGSMPFAIPATLPPEPMSCGCTRISPITGSGQAILSPLRHLHQCSEPECHSV